MVLKIRLNGGQHVSSATINERVPAYFEDQGFGFLYLPRLQTKKYVVKYYMGNELPRGIVYNDGTYNVYGFLNIRTKVYSSESVR